jgi:exopolysaccharide biosynthesis WecB/TagA/CpsF family protein
LIDYGKKNVLGVLIDATDYHAATERIISAAREKRGYSVSALAIHGVMTTVFDATHRRRLNQFDLVTPDGQGVRWAIDWLHRTGLPDRVYGPRLTLEVCKRCSEEGLKVFFYGSRPEVLSMLTTRVQEKYPDLQIAGSEPSQFRTTTREEQLAIAEKIRESGTDLLFVGLGCPRQEVFAFEYRDLVQMPCLAVGAAFDYHAGLVAEPPLWVQRMGLHGFYRAFQDPKRLWKRFFLLPPVFLSLLALQLTGLWTVKDRGSEPTAIRYG